MQEVPGLLASARCLGARDEGKPGRGPLRKKPALQTRTSQSSPQSEIRMEN